MTTTASASPFVWGRYARSSDDSARRRLVVAARKANTTEPGAEPDLWPLYRTEDSDPTSAAANIRWHGAAFTAEHLTIGLWGIHQQGKRSPMHHPGRSFALACRGLFDQTFHADTKIHSPSDAAGEDRITQRLAALGRAETPEMAARQMASLIRLFKSTDADLSLDYGQVFEALRRWSDPEIRGDCLRRWSADYYRTGRTDTSRSTNPAADASAGAPHDPQRNG